MIMARKQSGSFNPCRLVETLGNVAAFELHHRIAIQWSIDTLKVVACFQGCPCYLNNNAKILVTHID